MSHSKIEANYWIKLLNSDVVLAVDEFYEQLKHDEEQLILGKNVTDCAKYAPRLHSSIDKKYNIAHLLAFKLFPIDISIEDQSGQRKWSYIRYQQLLSKLSKAFIPDNNFHIFRKIVQRKDFCDLKQSSLSSSIINPTPMSVVVASEEQL